MAAHLGPFLTSQQTDLKTALSTLEEQNTTLAETIVQQRTEIDTLVRGLEMLVNDLEKAAEMVQEEEVRKLTQDTKAMREELRDGH
jgi:kinetochore protein NNF1